MSVPPEINAYMYQPSAPPVQQFHHHHQQFMGQPAMGQPFMGQSTVVQHTAVTITQEMPQDHFTWSLINFLYCNPFCLGLAALIHSVKSRDRKVVRDVEGSRSYGSTARLLNISATVVGSLIGLIGLIVFIVLFT